MSDDAAGAKGAYRTLDEEGGRLSEAEERFERARRTVGLVLAPGLGALVWLLSCSTSSG